MLADRFRQSAVEPGPLSEKDCGTKVGRLPGERLAFFGPAAEPGASLPTSLCARLLALLGVQLAAVLASGLPALLAAWLIALLVAWLPALPDAGLQAGAFPPAMCSSRSFKFRPLTVVWCGRGSRCFGSSGRLALAKL